jgi:hypothetical protein
MFANDAYSEAIKTAPTNSDASPLVVSTILIAFRPVFLSFSATYATAD